MACLTAGRSPNTRLRVLHFGEAGALGSGTYPGHSMGTNIQNGSAIVKQKSDVTCSLVTYAKSKCKAGKKKVLQAVSFRA